MSSTKDQIIDAVLAEVAEHGLANLTLKAVAARADVSIGLLSYHYKSRDDLLYAAAERWRATLAEAEKAAWGAFLDAPDSVAGLKGAVVTALEMGRRSQAELRMIMRHVIVEGEVPEDVAAVSIPLLGASAERAGALLGIPAKRARGVFHQFAILLARISLLSERELVAIYGEDDSTTPTDAWNECCRSAAETFVRALGVADREAGPL